MTREFVNYEPALALKELGFDEPVINVYDLKSKELVLGEDDEMIWAPVLPNNGATIAAPLYQQAFRWFREKYNLYSEINLDSYKEPYSLKVTITHLDDTNTFVDKEYYPYSNGIGDIDNKKYEEAEKACLDKLIEICKENGRESN